jgi:hypothetical protein
MRTQGFPDPIHLWHQVTVAHPITLALVSLACWGSGDTRHDIDALSNQSVTLRFLVLRVLPNR